MSLTSSRIVPSENAFAINPARSGGLVLHVCGGYLLGGPNFTSVQNATLTLIDNTVNYVELSAIGAIVSNTTAFTDGAIFLYRVTTLAGAIIEIEDWRAAPGVPAPNGVAVLQTSVTLTDAQIKALPTTPVEILAASPSPAVYRLWLGGFFSADFRGGAYGNLAANGTGILALQAVSGGNVFGPLRMDLLRQVFANANVERYPLLPNNQVISLNETPFGQEFGNSAGPTYRQVSFDPEVNGILQPALTLQLDNYSDDYTTALGNLTGGHADNTMTFTVVYSVANV